MYEDGGGVMKECFHVKDECLEEFKKSFFDQYGLKFLKSHE